MRKKIQVMYKPEPNVSKQKIQMSSNVANQESQMLREQILPSITIAVKKLQVGLQLYSGISNKRI